MNNGTNNFQNFIGISSLQKTLRNALSPTETTQQFIVKNGIIKEDELRGENRQILKDIMDDYYRGFISETLSSIDDIDWTSLFEKMEIQLKNGDNKDTLIKEQAEKRKAIYKKFADDDRFKNKSSSSSSSDYVSDDDSLDDDEDIKNYIKKIMTGGKVETVKIIQKFPYVIEKE